MRILIVEDDLKIASFIINIQAAVYWSSEYSLAPLHAWSFNFAFGDQGNTAFKCSYPYLGIAVREAKVVFE